MDTDLHTAADTLMHTITTPVPPSTTSWIDQLKDPTQPGEVTTKVDTLGTLNTAFQAELNENEPDNELVLLVEGYLQMTRGLYSFLLKADKTDKKTVENVRDALNDLSEEAQKTRHSLLNDTTLENFFIERMQNANVAQPIITETERLFNGERLALSDAEIVNLTGGWLQTITYFNNNPPSDIDPEAGFIELHSSLEILYERLEHVTRTDIDILSPSI